MKHVLLILALLSPAFLHSAEDIVPIAQFSLGKLDNWESHKLTGSTKYSIVGDEDQLVLKANSQQSASGLVKKQTIDLYKTPILNWRWKVENPLYRLTETFKEGDDFSARIYVIKDGGVFFWKTLALNYVWSSSQKKNSLWDNPFSSNAKMIAVESGSKLRNQWIAERRNVLQDLKKAFGYEIRFINAIAIMTDTDNSKQSAIAYYGDIYFSKN